MCRDLRLNQEFLRKFRAIADQIINIKQAHANHSRQDDCHGSAIHAASGRIAKIPALCVEPAVSILVIRHRQRRVYHYGCQHGGQIYDSGLQPVCRGQKHCHGQILPGKTHHTERGSTHRSRIYCHCKQNHCQFPEHGKRRNFPLAFVGHLPAAHNTAMKMLLFNHTAIGRKGPRNHRQNSEYQQDHQECYGHRLFFQFLKNKICRFVAHNGPHDKGQMNQQILDCQKQRQPPIALYHLIL